MVAIYFEEEDDEEEEEEKWKRMTKDVGFKDGTLVSFLHR